MRWAVAAALLLVSGPAGAIQIGNGVVGDGSWQVDVFAGGESSVGVLDPVGAESGDIIFQYLHFVDVGSDGGGVALGSTSITTLPHLSNPNEVSSAGTFTGANGAVNWTAVSSIAPGSPLYLTTLTFSSDGPLGMLRLIQYLDEDVIGGDSDDDRLIVVGTPGMTDFQLLTVDDTENIGVAHSATYFSATNMTYVGWAADEFPELVQVIVGGGANYSIAGVVDTTDLPSLGTGGDPRFPGLPAFGPRDIASGIAFDVNPEDSFASVILALGGSPEGLAPPTVPEPAGVALAASGLVALGGARARTRRPRSPRFWR